MSCYFRHLKEVFAEAGIQVTPENREQIDKAIKRMTDTDDCPETWAKVKAEIRGDAKTRQEFVEKLKALAK